MTSVNASFVFLNHFEVVRGFSLPVLYQEPTFANKFSATERAFLQPLAVGDFNNDQCDDILLFPADTISDPIILLSNGDGTFRRSEKFFGDAQRTFIRNASVADLNLDGWLDIVGFESTHLMQGQRDIILINDRGAGFRVLEPLRLETEGHHGGDVGDLNSDGLPDVFGLREFGSPNYSGNDLRAPLMQAVDGTFSIGTYQLPRALEDYAIGAMRIADLDGDGHDDVVFALARMPASAGGEQLSLDSLSRTPLLAIAFGEPGRPMQEWRYEFVGRHWIDEGTYLQLTGSYGNPTTGATAGANSLGIFDIDHDGDLDIIAGSYITENFLHRTGGFQVFINNSRKFTDDTSRFFPNQSANRDLAVGFNFFYWLTDLDGDGDKDFIASSGNGVGWPENSRHEGYPSIFLYDQGQFLPADVDNMQVFDRAVVGAYNIWGMLVGDFNGDGAPDIVSLRNESDFYWGDPRIDEKKGYEIIAHMNTAVKNDKDLHLTVLGTSANDTLISTALRPLLRGAAGNDVLHGVEGQLDTAVYYGALADFSVTRIGERVVLTDLVGNEGVDELFGVERVRFSDASLALDVNGLGGTAYRLYQAAYDRAPDAAGLGFWMHYLDRGFDLTEAANNFLKAPEFIAIYGADPTPEQYVYLLYKHVHHREPDAGGLQFWIDAMYNKDGAFGKQWTKGEILLKFSESTENVANLIGVMENGFVYTPFDPGP